MIYFITDGDAIKIGHARDPQKRLQHAQTFHSRDLKLLATQDGGRFEEQALHKKFQKYRLHHRREWFVACNEIIDYATRIRTIVEPDINGDTFYYWIIKQKAGDDCIGDFIRDVKDDAHFPKERRSGSDIESYLVWAKACNEALAAFRYLWQKYVRMLKDDGELSKLECSRDIQYWTTKEN